MPQQTTGPASKARLPGLDAAATPVIGIGLGLTGLALSLRPRLAAWPLALIAAAALLYRDPERHTPDEPWAIFAPADGQVSHIDELYEHRFLHTDAVRLTIDVAPLDVPVQRAPVGGTVALLERAASEVRPLWEARVSQPQERLFIGIEAEWGPVLLTLSAGPLARRIACRVSRGDRVEAGDRLSTVRLGSRVELLLPADVVRELPAAGARLRAGVTRVGALSAA
jgi:phosphatidylserine decarboxylase